MVRNRGSTSQSCELRQKELMTSLRQQGNKHERRAKTKAFKTCDTGEDTTRMGEREGVRGEGELEWEGEGESKRGIEM
jgi:hypothetical protein